MSTSIGPITQVAVARHAGVSVSAVHKVIRGRYGVSDELRGRVLAALRELQRPETATHGAAES